MTISAMKSTSIAEKAYPTVETAIAVLETTYSNPKEVVMEKKKELNPIKDQELDQVAGGLISPVEILQDRLIVGNMSCYNSGAFVGPEFEQDHKKE